jgi:preprotein translocase subunit SecG
MQTVIIVIHLLIVLTMIGLVLLQRSEGGGLGMGGGGFMSARGTANLLSRSTAYLAAAFFTTSLILSILAGYSRAPTSIINTGAPAGPSVPAPGGPVAPLGSGSGGVLDQLQRPAAPAAPAQPAGPQVPQSQ